MNQTQPDPDRKYSKADWDSITTIRKHTGTSTTEIEEEIFRLYKKYIQWMYSYTTGCNCSTGINTLWRTLNEYVSQNDSLFEKE